MESEEELASAQPTETQYERQCFPHIHLFVAVQKGRGGGLSKSHFLCKEDGWPHRRDWALKPVFVVAKPHNYIDM